MERDRINRQEAWKKIRSQMPSGQKVKQADYVIDTSGSLEETIRQSEVLYRRLLADYRKKNKKDVRPRQARLRPRAKRPEVGS